MMLVTKKVNDEKKAYNTELKVGEAKLHSGEVIGLLMPMGMTTVHAFRISICFFSPHRLSECYGQ